MTETQHTESIIVEDLVKLYGDSRALHKINFRVAPGEIVGFLGPNGAGKTTTMKILTCFMAATAGTAKVAGFDVHKQSEQVRRRLGYLPENVPLYDEMLVWDYLKFIAEIRGVPAKEHKARIDEVVALTGLSPVIHKSISELSKGYRQRVGLAQAIIHRPEVVILDEPTTGLDPNQIVEIRDVIKTIGQEKTVMFSTHIMQEVSAVCDRVIIINRGQIVADGTIDSLKAKLQANKPGLELELLEAPSDPKALAKRLEALKTLKRLERTDAAPALWRLEPKAEQAQALRLQLYELAAKDQLHIKRLSAYEPTLEEIFRALTQGQTEESAHTTSQDTPPSEDKESA